MSLPRLSRPAGALFLCFAIIAVLMVTHVTDAFDIQILQTVGSWRTAGVTTVMQGAEFIGNGKCEVPFALLVSALLWLRGRRRGAWCYFAVCLAAETLYLVSKSLFHRPRPTIITHLGEAGWYSFPSGHAMMAPVTWGLGLILLSQLVSSRATRTACWIAAVTICAVIASCRIYLGVHYPTDVLGGLFLGMAWVLVWWDVVSGTPTADASTA